MRPLATKCLAFEEIVRVRLSDVANYHKPTRALTKEVCHDESTLDVHALLVAAVLPL